MNTQREWYTVDTVDALDTPALMVYPAQIKINIQLLIDHIDDISRLRPHVKTHKSAEVTAMLLAAGIKKFKCATIAEAEMLANAGVTDILLAYQPVGPKANRFIELIKKFPSTTFACLIDSFPIANALAQLGVENNFTVLTYIDLNVGMNRTGIIPENAFTLFAACEILEGLHVIGLHAYDGHLRDVDFELRAQRCNEAFAPVEKLQHRIEKEYSKILTIVAGGTPTYSIHAKRKNIECSPGTFVYWDYGYASILQEQQYHFAAIILTRVISRPTPTTLCIDLGHKAVASENPLINRIQFLNAPALEPTGQSEEHMIFTITDGRDWSVGEVLYGVPYHVCPTVALHDNVVVVENHRDTGSWQMLARNRKISI